MVFIMTTELIQKWIEENPQSNPSFYVDVVYNFYFNDHYDQLPERCLERINTWFYNYNKSVWVFSKQTNQYQLKSEEETCFVKYSQHSLERTLERIDSFEFSNLLKNKSVKKILINTFRKNSIIHEERLLLVLVRNNIKIGYIVKPIYKDYLLKTLVVVTVIGHKQKYHGSNIKRLEITLKKKL